MLYMLPENLLCMYLKKERERQYCLKKQHEDLHIFSSEGRGPCFAFLGPVMSDRVWNSIS